MHRVEQSPQPRKRRGRAVAAGAALAVASFAAGHYTANNSAERATKSPAVVTTESAPTTSMPSAEKQIKLAVQNEAKTANHNFATSILGFAERSKDDPRVKVNSRRQADASPRSIGSDLTTTTVIVKTNSLIGPGDAQYIFSLTGKPQHNSEVVNPETVDSLSIRIAQGTDSQSQDIGPTDVSYKYDSFAVKDNWRLNCQIETKGATPDIAYYSTGDVSATGLESLTGSDLEYRNDQAAMVIRWAENFAPVDYVPGK